MVLAMTRMVAGSATPMVIRRTFGDFPFASLMIVHDWVNSSSPCRPQTPDSDGLTTMTGKIQQMAMKSFERVLVKILSLSLGK